MRTHAVVRGVQRQGCHIYTPEHDTIEKPGGNLDEHFKEMVNPTPSGVMLQKRNEEVNTFLEVVHKVVQLWRAVGERLCAACKRCRGDAPHLRDKRPAQR